MQGLLKRAEVAERLHVSPRTVMRLGRSGALTEVRVGTRTVRITPESVDRLIESGILTRTPQRSRRRSLPEACEKN